MTSASAAVCEGGDSRKKEIKLKGAIRSHTSYHYADNSKGTTAMDRHFEECKKAEDFLQIHRTAGTRPTLEQRRRVRLFPRHVHRAQFALRDRVWRFFEANCEKLGWRAFIGHDHLLQFHFEEIEGRKSLDYCLQVTIPPEICAGKDFDFDSYKQGSILEFPSEKSYFQSFEDGHFLYISPDFQDIEEKLKYLVRSMRVTLAAMKKGEGTEEGESSFQFFLIRRGGEQ